MTIEIKSIEIGADKVTIEGLAIEEVILADDLFEDFEVPTIKYEFDRKAKNGAEMKYLWKMVESQRRCASEKSFGKKLEKLTGAIVSISDSFRTKDKK